MQVRVARQSHRLSQVVAFYRDGLGLPEVARFEDHAGYDGVMLDIPGTGAHLEFTATSHVTPPAAHVEDLLVLYLGDGDAVERVLARLGVAPVPSANPYSTHHTLRLSAPGETMMAPSQRGRGRGQGRYPHEQAGRPLGH